MGPLTSLDKRKKHFLTKDTEKKEHEQRAPQVFFFILIVLSRSLTISKFKMIAMAMQPTFPFFTCTHKKVWSFI